MMRMSTGFAAATFAFAMSCATSVAAVSSPSCRKPEGADVPVEALPNAAAAARVATQILTGVYGAELVAVQVPLAVTVEADRYVFRGVRNRRPAVGGTATIVLCKANAAVLYMNHTK